MELLPHIHLVDGVTSNTYMIVEPDGLTVIDTGMPGSHTKMIAYVRRLGREPREVRRILLTHQHVDHVGGAAALARETGAEVVAHPADAPAIEGTAPRELPHGPLGPVFRLVFLPRLRPVRVTSPVRAGETLPVLAAEGGLRVIEAPGHTAGQIAFYLPGRKLLFAGDAWRHAGGRILPPPAMLNRDTPQTLRTFAELADTLELEASLPGHGTPMLAGVAARLAETVARLRGRGERLSV